MDSILCFSCFLPYFLKQSHSLYEVKNTTFYCNKSLDNSRAEIHIMYGTAGVQNLEKVHIKENKFRSVTAIA